MNLKVLNTNLYLKILYLKSKFRQVGAKIKISSDLLENVYTSQFEDAEYESDIYQNMPKIFKIQNEQNGTP